MADCSKYPAITDTLAANGLKEFDYSYFSRVCHDCGGQCCKKFGPFISSEDYLRLLRAGHSNFAKKRSFEGFEFYELRYLTRQQHCVFYDPDKVKCKINVIKPIGCRVFPCLWSNDKLDFDYSCLALRHGYLTSSFLSYSDSMLSTFPTPFFDTFNPLISQYFYTTNYNLAQNILPASSEHLESIMALEQISFKKGIAESKEVFAERLRFNSDTFWVYLEKEQIVGYYYCQYLPKIEFHSESSFRLDSFRPNVRPMIGECTFIPFSVAVHPDFRNRGIATKLALFAIGKAILSSKFEGIYFRTISQRSLGTGLSDPVANWMSKLFNIRIISEDANFDWGPFQTPSTLCQIVF